MKQQKHVLSLYTLPDGSDHNAAEIDTPDWESSTLYENGHAATAYLQMTHAVAWAILGDYSTSYAVAYWKLDAEGYSACEAIRTITCDAAPLADAALSKLEALERQATPAPWSINTNPKKWVGNELSDADWAANRDNDAAFVADLRNAAPGLLMRVRAADMQIVALTQQLTPGSPTERAPTQSAYEQACAALEKHRQRAEAAEARLAVKTYQVWENGPEMSATEYLQPGDEVDEEMVDHFGGVVSPQYCTHQFTQVGEAQYERDGRYHYMTFGRFDERYLYLGVLPPFKQPKH